MRLTLRYGNRHLFHEIGIVTRELRLSACYTPHYTHPLYDIYAFPAQKAFTSRKAGRGIFFACVPLRNYGLSYSIVLHSR